ncbi:MAG TPA: hypothetical protein VK512_03230 [Xanthobacteraceae bacterium]|nr:hypothetical protein [Xanthobacteraceae bacterium]
MTRIRKTLAVLATLIAVIASGLMGSMLWFDEHNPQQYLRGIPVGPSYEQAVRDNPGVREARIRSNIAKLVFGLIVFGAAIQISLVLTDKRT